MLGGYCEQLVELLGSAHPAEPIAIRLIPYLPIGYLPCEAVRPALSVVRYDMFANYRPFMEVLRRINSVLFDPVFDLIAKTEEGLGAGFDDSLQIEIGHSEIIGFRNIGICVKVREYIHYIDCMFSAVVVIYRSVVGAGIRDARGFVFRQISLILIVFPAIERSVIDSIHRLDRAERLIGVNGDFHFLLPFCEWA